MTEDSIFRFGTIIRLERYWDFYCKKPLCNEVVLEQKNIHLLIMMLLDEKLENFKQN